MTYFLAPGTSQLTFEQVIDWVIQENHESLNRNRQTLQTSLAGANLRRTGYLDELSSLSDMLDSTGDTRTRGELEARLSLVRANIARLEETISRHENRLEVIRLMEAEAQSHQHDEERPESQASDDVKVESSEEEGEGSQTSENRDGQPNTSGEGAVAASAASVSTVTPEEERLLLESAAPGDNLPGDTSSVTGHMAALHVGSPQHEADGDGETSQ